MVENRPIKVRPKRFAEIKLCVSQLPEQKIAYALLTARPNKQIRLWSVSERKEGLEAARLNRRTRPCKLGAGIKQLPGCLRNIPASSVIGANGQGQTMVASRSSLCLRNSTSELGLKRRQIADHPKSHASPIQFFDFAFKYRKEQAHENPNLLGWTTPVLGAECKEREIPNAPIKTS
jgi:hypothetical protein